ncbi:hypothetical protein C7974DRAFT_387611 [Boeremia exigua]|uniref:uncharacterized protein n=1 Tax=Boeremia exigua TaxID=749465 RepID=UPI001E8CE5F3|nr:uncharacterized protein C7974DRAFT_387611 [Boeremia exigua]KAH6638956.1 hypothetical protein C7974DRAFT_387611 [Boeremia exigua]
MSVRSYQTLLALWLEGVPDSKNGEERRLLSSPALEPCQMKEQLLGNTDDSPRCKTERRLDDHTENDEDNAMHAKSSWLIACAIGVVWCCTMLPVTSYRSDRDPQASESSIINQIQHPTAPIFALSCTIYGYALIGLYQHTRRSVFRAPLLIISILAALGLCAVQRWHVTIRPNIAVPVAVVVAMVLSRIAEGIRQTWMASSRH